MRAACQKASNIGIKRKCRAYDDETTTDWRSLH